MQEQVLVMQTPELQISRKRYFFLKVECMVMFETESVDLASIHAFWVEHRRQRRGNSIYHPERQK